MIALQEIVIASNELTKKVHRELFRLGDEYYILIDSYQGLIQRASRWENLERIHLALNWHDMMRFGTGRERPSKGDILVFLKKAGLSDREISPFRDPANEILAYLYYGKRFDILRRVCAETKRNSEKNLRGIRVNCHLIYEEISSIIASSL